MTSGLFLKAMPSACLSTYFSYNAAIVARPLPQFSRKQSGCGTGTSDVPELFHLLSLRMLSESTVVAHLAAGIIVLWG